MQLRGKLPPSEGKSVHGLLYAGPPQETLESYRASPSNVTDEGANVTILATTALFYRNKNKRADRI